MSEAAGETNIPVFLDLLQVEFAHPCLILKCKLQVQVLLDQGHRMPTQKHCTGVVLFPLQLPKSCKLCMISLLLTSHTSCA